VCVYVYVYVYVCVCVCVCVFVCLCDLETSTTRRPSPRWGCWAIEQEIILFGSIGLVLKFLDNGPDRLKYVAD
jgi:hypothetical protein